MLITIISPFFIKAIQLILSLSILIFIHEMGHLLIAKLFKVRVEKFYLFFNPNFSIFRMKKFNGKWHFALLQKNTTPNHEWNQHPDNTEWGIGWLPLGGYCSIAGMVDETKNESQLPQTPQPYEFRSQNAWKRLSIISGGVLVNFIFALLLFSLIIFHYGEQNIPLKNATQGLFFSDLLTQEGFQQHDKIISINNTQPYDLSDIFQRIIIDKQQNVTILRNNQTINLTMSPDLTEKLLAFQRNYEKQERTHQRNDPNYQPTPYIFMSEFFPFVVHEVLPNKAGFYAGLQPNDTITAINQIPTPAFFNVISELKKHPCDSITISFSRNGQNYQTKTFLSDRCKLDIIAKPKTAFIQIEENHYNLIQSIDRGTKKGIDILIKYATQLKLIFTKEGARSLGGFGSIGNLFPETWNTYEFWSMTALLSLILAFMNFLPLPALDGGYILFILIEIIFRYKIKDKYLNLANNIGMWLLLILVILANTNDILRFFF